MILFLLFLEFIRNCHYVLILIHLILENLSKMLLCYLYLHLIFHFPRNIQFPSGFLKNLPTLRLSNFFPKLFLLLNTLAYHYDQIFNYYWHKVTIVYKILNFVLKSQNIFNKFIIFSFLKVISSSCF